MNATTPGGPEPPAGPRPAYHTGEWHHDLPATKPRATVWPAVGTAGCLTVSVLLGAGVVLAVMSICGNGTPFYVAASIGLAAGIVQRARRRRGR